ncbi:MAG: UDP-N-acetylglucosamine 2-epimerase (non-hydrolyzing) [Candidatus Vecturithrix sp.]|jgi:UDP-GlcNAc3NAcA epimerase|nr:UDP-N-acetylglucosamine 2-epimerase (non-hydrolyzing) [Candidatus Vecturithrix sp.]
MNVITIVGARPQFIKAAVVSHAFAARGVSEMLVHTGQHFDANMSDVFFAELQIPQPAYHLGIGGGTHGQNTGRMIEAIEQVLLEHRPDWVLVYGDTDSTLAGTLAATKLHIPVAHVEAGLRSFNRRMPEEINRVLTDHAASMLFAPTDQAVVHLHNEGISGAAVQCVGDVMYDAALFYGAKAERTSSILSRTGLTSKNYVLATIHRAENTDDSKRLSAIFDGFSAFGQEIVLPLHPRTRARLNALKMVLSSNIRIVEPVGYLDMAMLEKNASLIATDSGGVQKEAFFYRVPCVTLRNETEWMELVDASWNHLAPPEHADVIDHTMRRALGTSGADIQPYGTGMASQIIVEKLLSASST